MFFLCSSCIVDSIHDVMLVLVLLLLGARQLKVENFIFLSNKKLPCQPTFFPWSPTECHTAPSHGVLSSRPCCHLKWAKNSAFKILALPKGWLHVRVLDPCIDFCGFDTAYIHAVSNAQKLYIRSPSNRDNFLPKSDNFPQKCGGGSGVQTNV